MEDYKVLMQKIDRTRVPKHIAVIMDGNGRWAKKRLQNRLYGHKHGAKAVRQTIEACHELGVEYLTLYAFSTENWRRSDNEVSGLLKLILSTLLGEIDELIKNNVRVKFIGSQKNLEANYLKKIHLACEKSKSNTGLHVNVAFNYGGRREILDAVNELILKAKNGEELPDIVDESYFEEHLYTAGIPDPELLIRTSGEIRLSNYLIWQTAYTEFWFTDELWPDFNKSLLVQAVLDYQKRDRRLGAE
ncbi:MAG: isoprenyl transferase [Candidatus Cloacimonetes bacterium 4572_65]|nr:MAG: isoprenyl transferase [Candidatus Cloacimonetes bacterium 4572_65]